MTDIDIKANLGECPVCAERLLLYVTCKRTIRSKVDLPLYFCMACKSFSCPSGFIEDDLIQKQSLEWHIAVTERNRAASLTLLRELKLLGVDPSRILDIGAGIGTFLRTAADNGIAVVGYDINPLTQPYAKTVNNLDVRAEYWTPETNCGNFDLMTCIMLMEHIETPRPLLRGMVEACVDQKAHLFVSVPFVDRSRWHFIHESDPKAAGNPFFDNDMHVTHYSPEAMEQILREFGMKKLSWIKRGLWHGILASAHEDIAQINGVCASTN